MIEKSVAIVTGGATGIGAACCRALAAEGFYVGIHYRKSVDRAQKLLDEIKEGFLIKADLVNIDDVEELNTILREGFRTIANNT